MPLELLMHRCNNTCSRQKCLISSKVFHCRKAEISIYISDWIQWGIGTYQSVVEYIYCWVPGNHRLVHWQEGWCLPKKRKELIRHVKQKPKDTEFVQLYHERAETTITIATRINSSFYIDTTRPLPPSVGFGELSLPPMLSLYKLQQT